MRGLRNLILCVIWAFVDRGFHLIFWTNLGRWLSSSLCFPISWWRYHRFLSLPLKILSVCWFRKLTRIFTLPLVSILLFGSSMLKNRGFLLWYLLFCLSCFCFLYKFWSCCVWWDGVSFCGVRSQVFIILLVFLQL